MTYKNIKKNELWYNLTLKNETYLYTLPDDGCGSIYGLINRVKAFNYFDEEVRYYRVIYKEPGSSVNTKRLFRTKKEAQRFSSHLFDCKDMKHYRIGTMCQECIDLIGV